MIKIIFLGIAILFFSFSIWFIWWLIKEEKEHNRALRYAHAVTIYCPDCENGKIKSGERCKTCDGLGYWIDESKWDEGR